MNGVPQTTKISAKNEHKRDKFWKRFFVKLVRNEILLLKFRRK